MRHYGGRSMMVATIIHRVFMGVLCFVRVLRKIRKLAHVPIFAPRSLVLSGWTVFIHFFAFMFQRIDIIIVL